VRKVPVSRIRNFSIIAHIDHGKSTLADTLLLRTGTVAARDAQAQFLDNMDLERERGITIKLQAARMHYTAADGLLYVLNLIDTPGHVDFSYEVSRSLAACEGALLVVDASQGVEAQTVANVYLALDGDLEVIPVLNKIDLPGAEPERVREEISNVLGIDCSGAILASAKQRVGIDEILETIVARVPPPKDTSALPLRALIFDSYYDSYRGVVVMFRVMDGVIKRGDSIRMMNTGAQHDVVELGVMSPGQKQVSELGPGEVGYFAAGIKAVADARVGDTITLSYNQAPAPLPGYAEAQPMVFCGLFPVDADAYGTLRESLGRLQLNDAALRFEPETSSAMGFGFRCGFLGLLHMEIVQERLEREYNLDLITTAPSVVYRVTCNDGSVVSCDNPADLPSADRRDFIEEPYVKLDVITPAEYNGAIMELSQERRGSFINLNYMTETRATLSYELPLAEVVTDFFDELKSRTRGYASMEYSFIGYRRSELVLLEVKINAEPCDPLAVICHRDKAYNIGRALVSKLKELIPRQQFQIPIQAAVGSRVIASEKISAMRKDVLAKCYGGDISRKKKLLNKQAAGKKRMKALGKVEVPQEAFMAVLKLKPGGAGGGSVE
jgi:GTP-binding protein LepA